jgi:DNA-binding Lrp family transcriptional regulator
MLDAYVLIQTEVGRAAQVARAIRELDAVDSAEDVAGPYDVIARVHARGIDDLGRLVVARIQAVGGITRTLTCSVIKR